MDSGMVIVIGRGNGGTRLIAETLRKSGVFTGQPLNFADDLIPPDEMYEACRIASRKVDYNGCYQWDFSRLVSGRIDRKFKRLINSYIASVLESGAPWRGWKIPETTLCYPWIARMFPDAHYILWNRDPRDALLGFHMTDELAMFAIPRPYKEDVVEVRSVSWIYQAQLMASTPIPRHCFHVKFEDFVLSQKRVLDDLERFLGFDLVQVEVRPEEVGKVAEWPVYPSWLYAAMPEFGYSARLAHTPRA